MAGHDVSGAKTDDIFTDITVYYSDKKQVKKEQEKGLSRETTPAGIRQKISGSESQEMRGYFYGHERRKPKVASYR